MPPTNPKKDSKVRVYKNPDRNRPTNLKPYIPQYQLMGVEPEEYYSPSSPGYANKFARPQPLPKDNPRAPRTVVRRQPYAEAIPSPVGRGRGLLPNVGNNIEQTWSSVDGDVVDDLGTEVLDPDQPMIDNNEFVSDKALGLPPDPTEVMEVEEGQYTLEDDVQELNPDESYLKSFRYGKTSGGFDESSMKEAGVQTKNFLSEDELQNALKDEYLSSVISSLEEDDHLLIVNGAAICSGPMEDIQEQARALVFGEHPLCSGNPMAIDDIVVLKKVKIKVGLFLE